MSCDYLVNIAFIHPGLACAIKIQSLRIRICEINALDMKNKYCETLYILHLYIRFCFAAVLAISHAFILQQEHVGI